MTPLRAAFRRIQPFVSLLSLLVACSSKGGGGGNPSTSSGSTTTSTGSTTTSSSASGASSSGASSSGSSGTGGASGGCNPDPLHTGLVAQQTGVSVDAFDCPILQWAAHYDEPDPMVFKAIIYVESRFDQTAVACPNLPCGTPNGWMTNECGCFGLMQVVPACGPTPMNAGLLPNGHPNLTTDTSSSSWAGSIFNPENNIEVGIAGIAGNRAQVKMMFPGCTEDQYTMMAVGNYNSYGSTKSCTQYNAPYDDAVIMAYKQYASAAGYPAHNY